MDSDVLRLRTGSSLVTDITQQIRQFCRDRGYGLSHVFVPHATAGVALIDTGAAPNLILSRPLVDCFLARMSTGTSTVVAAMAVIMCCRPSFHPRLPCQC